MAKLNGVKVIDMTGGEVTKIAYEGAEYKKVEGMPNMTDLIQTKPSWHSCESESFRKVVGLDDDGDARVETDGGYASSNYRGNYNVFRKVKPKLSADEYTESPSLASRVSTLESDVAELKGEATNYVKAVKCLDARKDGLTGFGELGQGLVKIGAIGELIEKTDRGVLVKFNKSDANSPEDDDYKRFFLRHGEYEFVTQTEVTAQYAIDARECPAKQYRKITRKPKAGDYVKWSVIDPVDEGDVVTEKFYEVKGVDFDGDLKVTNEKGYTTYADSHNSSEEFEVYEKVSGVKSESPKELQAGGYAKVTGNCTNHEFPVGTIVKLSRNYETGKKAEYVDGSDWWLVAEKDLTPATDEEVRQAKAEAHRKSFSDGDYARVIKNYAEHDAGDIVKVTNASHNGYHDFGVDNLRAGKGFIDADKVEKLSESEAKTYVRWTKIGRKPNEFKEGDIVRVDWIYKKGEVDELVEIDRGPDGSGLGGNYYLTNGEGTLGDHIVELITPVENRFDLAE